MSGRRGPAVPVRGGAGEWGGERRPRLPWLGWARRDLASRPLPLPLVWPLLRDGVRVRPEFLTPAPASRVPSFDEESERLRATPQEHVRSSLGRVFAQFTIEVTVNL